MRKGRTFIISGPSGVGKSTVLRMLFEGRDDLYFSVSATTRAPRAGERDGVHYRFIDLAGFQELIRDNALLEYAEYVGNFYGTPARYVDEAMEAGRDAVLDIDVQGARQIAEKRPDVVRVFLAPPSWEELARRLAGRGTDSEEKIQERLTRAREEFRQAGEYDYLVINESAARAAEELNAILIAEHCRPAERMRLLKE